MPRRGSPYGPAYQRRRAALLGRPCHWCNESGSDSADHVPPLHQHRHREGSGCCHLEPAHLDCNIKHSGGWRAAHAARRAAEAGPVWPADELVPAPSRDW